MQNVQPPESQQPIPLDADKVFSGIVFDVYQWQQKLFDGSFATFEKLKRDDTVLVIPVTTSGTIILTEQEQPGKKPFLSFAGGRVNKGESVLNAAKRELLEETGYKAKELLLFESKQPVSKIEWAVYTFIAKGCEKVQDQKLEQGEKVVLRLIDFDEFIEIVSTEGFHEIHLALEVLRAKLDKERMEQLKRQFS
jgi:ADP-ribose pyrophosphatase